MLSAVLYPAWVWTRDEEHTFLVSSYAQELSDRDSVKCRDLIRSEWYQERFPNIEIKADENQKRYFELVSRGNRRAISTGSRATGFRGHTLIVDDPLNAKESGSEASLFEHVDYFDRVLASRSMEPETFRRIVIMQRLHGADLAGRLIDRGWTSLVLPMEFDPERKCMIEVTGFEDPRTEPGEILFPERYPDSVLDSLKISLGSDFEGQYNQIPVSAEGGEVKKHWIRYWYPKDGPVPKPVRMRVNKEYVEIPQVAIDPDELYQGQSWDPSVKETKNGSFCCGLVWGHKGPNDYLLDMFHKRCEFTAQVDAVRHLSKAYPLAATKLVEAKANGPAIISQLKSSVGGIVAVETPAHMDKVGRFKSVAPYIRAGNVYLPHPDLFPWVNTVINEWCQFPKAPNDDIVDATSQWLDHRHRNGLARLERLTAV